MDATLRFPSIDGLRAFETAARLGSFERAADELAITPSAVSKRIATVEELIGTPLFTRGARALQLTASGKEYLAQVSAALGLLAAVPLHQRQVQRAQRLRVSAPPTFARQILVPALERFGAAHPDIELEVLLSIPYLGASGPDADIEVQFGAAPADAEAPPPLMHDRLLPLAAPTLLARLAPLRAPADLAGVPLLRTPLDPWAPWFRAAGLGWGEPTQGTRFVDLGLVLEAAVGGQGIALGRPSLARHWLAGGALVAPFTLSAEPASQYRLAPYAAQGAAPLFARWLALVCDEAAAGALALLSRRA